MINKESESNFNPPMNKLNKLNKLNLKGRVNLKPEVRQRLDEVRLELANTDANTDNGLTIDEYIRRIQITINDLEDLKGKLTSLRDDGFITIRDKTDRIDDIDSDSKDDNANVWVQFTVQDTIKLSPNHRANIETIDNSTHVIISVDSVKNKFTSGKYQTLNVNIINTKNMNEVVAVKYDTTSVEESDGRLIAKGIVGRRIRG